MTLNFEKKAKTQVTERSPSFSKENSPDGAQLYSGRPVLWSAFFFLYPLFITNQYFTVMNINKDGGITMNVSVKD